MELMKSLTLIKTSKGKMLPPGTLIRTQHPEKLIASGKARRLSPDERRGVLRAYVDYARQVFQQEMIPAPVHRKKKGTTRAHKRNHKTEVRNNETNFFAAVVRGPTVGKFSGLGADE